MFCLSGWNYIMYMRL